jgi:nucleoside-diphosphate-sugar epimerase
MSSYYILEVASELKLKSVCLASSISAIGYNFQEEPIEIAYLPVDENHPATPRDPYALGKRVIEVTAEGFGRLKRPPVTISTLRYPNVAYEEELKKMYVDADLSLEAIKSSSKWSNFLFTYLHIEDAAEVARYAIEANFTGHETFWAVAEDTIVDIPTEELIKEFFPYAELRSSLVGFQSLISIKKAKRMLDWQPKHSWRDL